MQSGCQMTVVLERTQHLVGSIKSIGKVAMGTGTLWAGKMYVIFSFVILHPSQVIIVDDARLTNKMVRSTWNQI